MPGCEVQRTAMPPSGPRSWSGSPLPPAEWTLERMRKVKYALAGTVDQVKAEIAALHEIGGKGELEWFGWFFDQGFMSMDEEMRQIELFAKHIIPAFR